MTLPQTPRLPEPTPSARFWDYKPWWCQPWSIVLTGTLLAAGSWWLARSLWLTLPLSSAIALWWIYFLLVVPRWFRQQLEQR